MHYIAQLVERSTWKQSREFSLCNGGHEANFFSISRKLAILKQAETSSNIRAPAYAYNVQSNQIRHLRNGILELIERRPLVANLAL